MDWRIIEGDSLEAIPDEDFHLVVTSPPYNVGKDYDGHDDTLSLGEWRALVTTVLSESWNRLVHADVVDTGRRLGSRSDISRRS